MGVTLFVFIGCGYASALKFHLGGGEYRVIRIEIVARRLRLVDYQYRICLIARGALVHIKRIVNRYPMSLAVLRIGEHKILDVVVYVLLVYPELSDINALNKSVKHLLLYTGQTQTQTVLKTRVLLKGVSEYLSIGIKEVGVLNKFYVVPYYLDVILARILRQKLLDVFAVRIVKRIPVVDLTAKRREVQLEYLVVLRTDINYLLVGIDLVAASRAQKLYLLGSDLTCHITEDRTALTVVVIRDKSAVIVRYSVHLLVVGDKQSRLVCVIVVASKIVNSVDVYTSDPQ